MELLAELNKFRERDGRVPLKKWVGTEDQLRLAVIDRRKAQSPQLSDDELVSQYLEKGGDITKLREHSAKGVKRQGGRKNKRTALRHASPRLKGSIHRVKSSAIPPDCFTLIELTEHQGGYEASDTRARARKIPELATMNVPELGRWVFRRTDWDRIGRLIWPRAWKG